jgi:hypothetical protein
MLRWSDDGGHTWGNEHWSSMGKIGAYYQRVFWRRLGMTLKLRDRVYEISGTDPVKVASGRMVTIFNVCGNDFRLITAIHYDKQRLYTLRFMTHADYSKNDWKKEL